MDTPGGSCTARPLRPTYCMSMLGQSCWSLKRCMRFSWLISFTSTTLPAAGRDSLMCSLQARRAAAPCTVSHAISTHKRGQEQARRQEGLGARTAAHAAALTSVSLPKGRLGSVEPATILAFLGAAATATAAVLQQTKRSKSYCMPQLPPLARGAPLSVPHRFFPRHAAVTHLLRPRVLRLLTTPSEGRPSSSSAPLCPLALTPAPPAPPQPPPSAAAAAATAV
jgi:hypothetical protein